MRQNQKKLGLLFAVCSLFLILIACAQQGTTTPGSPGTPGSSVTPEMFPLAESCAGCHDSIVADDGSTYSYVQDWKQNAHAQSALDPLFLAVARAETMNLPGAEELIQSVCAACHLPMADLAAQSMGMSQAFLDNAASSNNELYPLYKDGDSCMICHQLTSKKTEGNAIFRDTQMSIDLSKPQAGELRSMYGQYALSEEGQNMMKNVIGYESISTKTLHGELICSPCHTLYTDSFTVEGVPTGKQLPEQVTVLEWNSSSYWNIRSCQACHMPVVTNSGTLSNRALVNAVTGQINAHTFLGSNSYLLRMLNDRFGSLDQGIANNDNYLLNDTAILTLNGNIKQNPDGSGLLALDVRVGSITGHKFPTGFPSRRAWIHVKVLDETGKIIYESGAYNDKGMILDDNADLKKGEFEPHYNVIDKPGQVQIYEAVMIDSTGKATTNLLHGIYYGKDNRLLPDGFNKKTAHPDCAVIGDAMDDEDFVGGSDTVHYLIQLPEGVGTVTIEVELLYQTVSYRFLENLKEYPSAEQQALAELVQKTPNIPSLVVSKQLKVSR